MSDSTSSFLRLVPGTVWLLLLDFVSKSGGLLTSRFLASLRSYVPLYTIFLPIFFPRTVYVGTCILPLQAHSPRFPMAVAAHRVDLAILLVPNMI